MPSYRSGGPNVRDRELRALRNLFEGRSFARYWWWDGFMELEECENKETIHFYWCENPSSVNDPGYRVGKKVGERYFMH